MSSISTAQFLADLRGRDIQLWCEGENLRFSAPPGALTEELRGELRARKAEILASLAAPAAPELELIPRADRAAALPLSFQQERLWLHDRIEPGVAVYNVPLSWRLRGPLDADILARCLAEIARRHETLRTTFAPATGVEVAQAIQPFEPRALRMAECRGTTAEARDAELVQLIGEEAKRPFDLARGPLWRATLVRLAAEDHALLLTWHHIVFDAWSGDILARELEALFRAFQRGEPSPLAELPVQYADFAQWQRRSFDSARMQTPLAFWRARLSASAPPLALPLDRPRPTRPTYRGELRSRELPASCKDGLREIARAAGATMFMTLLAAFKALLVRYSGESDISIGTPIAQRPRVETEGLIGFFLNMLVLRTDASGDPTFHELLQRVRGTAVEAFENQEVPFEKLVEELRPARHLHSHPFFQIAFVMQREHAPAFALPGVAVEPIAVPGTTAKFDLTLSVDDSQDRLLATFEYSTELFDRATIDRLLGSLEVLVAGIIANPDTPLSRLPLLEAAERRRILVEWNDTRADYPRDVCLHELIEAQVTRTPDVIALVFENETLTYRELNRRANGLAQTLRGFGVGPETLVAICVERSIEMVVGLVAILKAGGAYVPLDPHYPPERLAFMLADANAPVLLTQTHVLARLPKPAAHTICLDAFDGVNNENPASGARAENLAYVIYTSGSTGQPKGAMNTHRGICNRLLWMQDAYGIDATDRVLQKTPFTFDVSVWEFFWPLITGARLVVAKPDLQGDSAYLVKTIRESNITTMHFVPPMLSAFLTDRNAGTCDSLKRVICSGEALPPETQRQFFQTFSETELHNLYGPTEASVDVTAWACQRDDEARSVPIGRPVANTQIYILDRAMQPVPVGVAGELHIGGVQLARGYLGRPDLTAEKFVRDPFSDDAEARLYKTGDLARFRTDGAIDFLGRIDHQVKIRGFRIEPGEIESALKRQPDVLDAAVLVREDVPGHKRLVAYVVGKNGTLSPATLASALKESLPDYMVPSAIVALPALPTLPNGKLNRHALPAPDDAAQAAKKVFVAPRTPLEETLATIWKDALNVERIDVHDNFFELGGDSLLGLRIVNRLREVLGCEISIGAIFATPTIGALAATLAKNHPASGATPSDPRPASAPIQRVAREMRRVTGAQP